jgi:hypothetical protein
MQEEMGSMKQDIYGIFKVDNSVLSCPYTVHKNHLYLVSKYRQHSFLLRTQLISTILPFSLLVLRIPTEVLMKD